MGLFSIDVYKIGRRKSSDVISVIFKKFQNKILLFRGNTSDNSRRPLFSLYIYNVYFAFCFFNAIYIIYLMVMNRLLYFKW